MKMPESADLAARVFWVLIIIVVGFYAVNSLLFTSLIDDAEVTYYKKDNVILLVASIVGFCLLFAFLFKKAQNTVLANINVLPITLIVIAIIGCMLVTFSHDIGFWADQDISLAIARSRDFTGNIEGSYLSAYPFQIPWIIVAIIANKIAGTFDYILLRYVNVAGIVIIVYCLSKITDMLFRDKFITQTTTILCIGFIPLFMYIFFVYNTILGFMFAMLSAYFFLRYIFADRKRFAIVSFICISAAFLLRQSHILFIIAMIIVGVWLIVKRIKPAKTLALLASFIIVILFATSFVNSLVEIKTGKTVQQGVPITASIAMGMQESPRAPGWYNRYSLTVLEDAGFDSDLADEAARQEIADRVKVFSENPLYALEFFYKKATSMWNDPTFQGIWVVAVPGDLNAENSAPLFSQGETTVAGFTNLSGFMNWYQSLVLVLAAVAIALNRKRWSLLHYLPLIIFLGSVCFFMILEAKSQYSVFFFTLLIPYAAIGLKGITGFIYDRLEKR